MSLHKKEMDRDLFLDLTAFCPEKYFVHKSLSNQTRMSFADYERKFYWCRKTDHGVVWCSKLDYLGYQEYGPWMENYISYIWLKNGRIHRSKGPAVIFKKPRRIIISNGQKFVKVASNYNSIDFPIDTNRKITKIWVEDGKAIKVA